MEKLAVTLKLEMNSLYVKVEASAEDVIIFLRTLYLRAEDFGLSPLETASFHAILLLASTGGFRTGQLVNTKFNQYKLSFIRDPNDRSQHTIICTPKIYRNKIKKKQLTVKYKKGKLYVLCLATIEYRTN